MKSLMDLWRISANELAEWCHTSAAYDIKTVVGRAEDEGFSFLTITLPAFGKDFERSLDRMQIDSDAFLGFRRRRGLPAFLSGFLSQVFCPDSGALLTAPNIDCIFAVRFLTGLYAKIELPCSNTRVTRAMLDYVSCENELRRWESTASTKLLKEFQDASHLLFTSIFTRLDKSIYDGELVGKHGPGSTADGLAGNRKFSLTSWTTRLEQIFPYGENCIPNWRYYYLLDGVEFVEPGAEQPVKVISVPKTLRSPRIIAMEPTCMQYMQQAILNRLVPELEDPQELVSNFLGFSDQMPNRQLARVGSLTGQLATLDLKEASDRVPYLLVQVMLERFPWLYAGVDASRSTRAEIPALGLCLPDLAKFASMGSALCFPFEAMVFITIVFMGLARQASAPLSTKLIKSFVGKVRVYGDDIIVPADSVDYVIAELEAFGFKINRDKSFWNGKFRESCGGDYYDGQDVTPIRLKQVFPSSHRDATGVAALVEFRNRLYLRGMWKTTSWLDSFLGVTLKGIFPIVQPTSPGMGRLSFLPYQEERMDDQLHAPRVRAWTLKPRLPSNPLDEEWALLKCFITDRMIDDPKHLERSGRPVAVDTKLRWVSPF